jgi:transcription elongation factor Elf1
MQKVDAQSNYIEKADATAKAQAKQLLDQNKRMKQSEEEIIHFVKRLYHFTFLSSMALVASACLIISTSVLYFSMICFALSQLMQKVDAQSNYIEKADATAKAQAKQLLDQNKRIKQSEEEIQHVKTTQMIDKYAASLPFMVGILTLESLKPLSI